MLKTNQKFQEICLQDEAIDRSHEIFEYIEKKCRQLGASVGLNQWEKEWRKVKRRYYYLQCKQKVMAHPPQKRNIHLVHSMPRNSIHIIIIIQALNVDLTKSVTKEFRGWVDPDIFQREK